MRIKLGYHRGSSCIPTRNIFVPWSGMWSAGSARPPSSAWAIRAKTPSMLGTVSMRELGTAPRVTFDRDRLIRRRRSRPPLTTISVMAVAWRVREKHWDTQGLGPCLPGSANAARISEGRWSGVPLGDHPVGQRGKMNRMHTKSAIQLNTLLGGRSAVLSVMYKVGTSTITLLASVRLEP